MLPWSVIPIAVIPRRLASAKGTDLRRTVEHRILGVVVQVDE